MVTSLNGNDVFPIGPASGDRAKGITFSNLGNIIEPVTVVIVEVSGDYTVTVNDDYVAVDGAAIVTLPASIDAFNAVTIKSVLGGGILTLTPVGADTIDGAATQPIAINASLTIFPVIAGWLIA